MVSIRQLEYLIGVAEEGHFGRAAERLNVSQPTLSHQLKALEERLGTALLDRAGRGVSVTPAGREIVDRARAVLREVQELKHVAALASSGPLGRVRFGVSPTLGPYLMPQVIASLHRDVPDLKLLIREGIPDRQIGEIAHGGIDMILAPMPVRGEHLHVEHLFDEPLAVIAPPEHPFVKRDSIALGELAGATFVTIDRRHNYHRAIERLCERSGAVLMGDYEGTSLDSLRQMVGSGVGLALLPELYLRSEASGKDMVRRLNIDRWSERRSIAAVWRKNAAYADVYGEIARRIADQARVELA